jgi:hypothetical protein
MMKKLTNNNGKEKTKLTTISHRQFNHIPDQPSDMPDLQQQNEKKTTSVNRAKDGN